MKNLNNEDEYQTIIQRIDEISESKKIYNLTYKKELSY